MSNEISNNNTNSNIRINLNEFIAKFQGTNVLDYAIHELVIDCIIKGDEYIILPKSKIEELNIKLSVFKKQNETLIKTAHLNNDGIEQEKKGNVDLAIEIYEENIKHGYAATHAYERLMKLYRKRKDFENEIRIIQIAIQIFTLENEKRYKRAISEAKSEKVIEEIKNGHKNGSIVRGLDGWVIYSPYPVKEYINRLQKSLQLINK